MKHNCYFQKRRFYFAVTILLLALPALLWARDLVMATRAAKDQVVTLAQVASGIGIAVGAIAYSIGASMLGRTMLLSGVVGVLLSVGGPSLINLIQTLF